MPEGEQRKPPVRCRGELARHMAQAPEHEGTVEGNVRDEAPRPGKIQMAITSRQRRDAVGEPASALLAVARSVRYRLEGSDSSGRG